MRALGLGALVLVVITGPLGGGSKGKIQTPGVIAHRGATAAAPENTLPAIQEAIQIGCTVAEIDIRYTSDGEPILLHDATVNRTTNGSGQVSEMNMAEIGRLDAGGRSGKDLARARIPTLKEAIELARGKIDLYLDMKEEDPAPAARLVKDLKGQSFVWFRSSNAKALKRLMQIDPTFRVLLHIEYLPPAPAVLLALHREFSTASFSASLRHWTPELLAEARRLGVRTVADLLGADDNPEHWRRAIEMGFDYIETDHPQLVLQRIQTTHQPDYASLADDLIQRILTAVRRQLPPDLAYRERRTTEYLGPDGKVLRARQAVYQWRIQSGNREHRLVGLDGKEIHETFLPAATNSAFSDWDAGKWLELYDFKIIGAEKVREDAAIRIHFFPKKRQPRPNRRLEKVIMNLEGDLWLTPATRNLLKASVRLRRPIRFGAGFLGAVKRLEIHYSQQFLQGQFLPESFRFELSMREFFRTTRFRESRRYADFALPETGPTEASASSR